jgi:hypothetical protein
LKYYELSLLTGQSPTQIETVWSEEDVNMALLVHNAQQSARVQIAIDNKVDIHNVLTPVSVVVRRDEN